MERTKYFLIVILCCIFIPLVGQSNKQIYEAFISGDMVKWKNTMDALGDKLKKTNEDKLNLINFQYGYIAWCIDNDKKHEAERYIAKSEVILEQFETEGYNSSMLYAYRASIIGYKIGISPFLAPFIGAESIQYAKKSVNNDSTNALGYVQLGNIANYTPSIFGGSKKDALKHYNKALDLMEKDSILITDNWNYLNLLATIITVYLDLGQYSKAEQFCNKSLIIEPRFEWVKNKLYPQVLNHLDYD